ncbi:hypothetical protein EFK50_09245 [Nocardioides marmoriginsengisoli]|uniref:Uncharacterized protein n=1 Tax=Nocardioides marmoriginsengisoli TaxID=661483 RepID=A0A3N0CG84_9ACTN|nr:hypothetical protein [Nocardioides marmoriginsengisoli]RNL62003.1 hypothetical protein EFK50_09245 [Nocardioides marmoriginsengisoli]
MPTQTQRPESLVDDPGIWFGIATGLVIVTFLIAGLSGFGAVGTGAAVLLVGGLAAVRLPGLIALALGIVVWAFYTGFTENSLGQLTFAAGDLVRLAGFAVATVAIAQLVRSLHDTGTVREVRHG